MTSEEEIRGLQGLLAALIVEYGEKDGSKWTLHVSDESIVGSPTKPAIFSVKTDDGRVIALYDYFEMPGEARVEYRIEGANGEARVYRGREDCALRPQTRDSDVGG